MPDFSSIKSDLIQPRDSAESDAFVAAGQALNREAQMICSGLAAAALETVENPAAKMPELVASFATGFTLGAISRLGAPGRAIAGGVGAAIMLKFAYDEISGQRWSNFGAAVKNNWYSGDNMSNNIEATKNSLGAFLIDTGLACAGMGAGSYLTSKYAPPKSLMNDALKRSGTDGGVALLNLQNRWENPGRFQKQVAGQLELIAYSEPAYSGEARGDFIKVAKTPEGKILLSAMDVEGHGLSAAKKSAELHLVFEQILPDTKGSKASEILSKIDEILGTKDNLAVTAGLMTYDPRTHQLQTATASCELAYLIEANGAVRRLDAEGGFGLGLDWYAKNTRGNEVISLKKGDTVIMASDGVFDRFGRGNWGGLPENTTSLPGFKAFLEKVGPEPKAIKEGILETPPPKTGVDDASFIVFRRL